MCISVSSRVETRCLSLSVLFYHITPLLFSVSFNLRRDLTLRLPSIFVKLGTKVGGDDYHALFRFSVWFQNIVLCNIVIDSALFS